MKYLGITIWLVGSWHKVCGANYVQGFGTNEQHKMQECELCVSYCTVNSLHGDMTYTAFGGCMGDHGANYFRNFKWIVMKLAQCDCHGGFGPDMCLDDAST